MLKKSLFAAATLAGLSLTACGDDVTEVNEIHQDGMAVLEAGEKLSKQACDTTNVGEMLFVMDSSEAFICDGESWQTLKGEKGDKGGKGDPGKDGDNGTGCTSKSVKNKSGIEGVEVTCGETVIDTIWNGKDGENGKPGDPGKPGEAGTSCTAKSVKNKSGIEGVEVTCGETVVDTIWNGKNGKDGEDGDNGTSCTAKSVKNKSGLEGLEVTCGETVIDTIWNGKNGQNGNNGTSCIAEPVKNAAGLNGLEVTCGETVVDTIWNGKDGQNGNNGTSCTATVNQDGGFDLVCDGQTVGTITNGEDGVGCTLNDEGDGKVTVSCGKGSAMTTTILYKAVCGTVAYDPAKLFCSEGGLYSCDDKPYDPAKSFCSEGTLYSCGDKPYDPAKSFCSEGEAYDLCDGKTYDPKTQYCLKVTRGGTDIYSEEALLTDARDAQNIQVYKTVKICNDDKTSCQTWMAENLNYSVNPGEQSWCGGGEDGTKNEGDCSVYGRLYTWAAAVGKSEDECGNGKTCNLPSGDIRGVCPEGWHLPSKDEWNALITAVGGTDVAGKNLKADSDLWYEGTSNDDSFGFAVLPAGHRYYDGSFYYGGYRAYFWSSTEDGSTNAKRWSFYYDYDDVGSLWDYEHYGFSVRCLRDSN